MHERKSRLEISAQYKLIEHFVAGTTADAVSELFGIQPNMAIKFYKRLRIFIASKSPSDELNGGVEIDESYFGGIRKRKKRSKFCW